MTTYISDSWRLSDAYVNNTGEIPPPSKLMVGEIPLRDGTTYMYIAQTPKFHGVPIQDTHPQEDGLSFTGVMDAFVEEPQSHAKTRVRVPRVPVGGIVMVMAGLILVAFGLVMNSPVSWFIYNMIHK